MSHKDPSDAKKVISIQFLDEQGKRVGTGHLHEDGTSRFRYKQKQQPSESPSQGYVGFRFLSGECLKTVVHSTMVE